MLPPKVNYKCMKERQKELQNNTNNTSGTNQQVKLNINQSCNTKQDGTLLYSKSQNSKIVRAKKVGFAADTKLNKAAH